MPVAPKGRDVEQEDDGGFREAVAFEPGPEG